MSTTPVAVTIAALRTHNARLVQDNDRLARENAELRTVLETRPAAKASATADSVVGQDANDRAPHPRATDPVSGVAGSAQAHPSEGFAQIAAESTANARVPSLGSLAGGELRAVGFADARGYLEAIRRGVPAGTHATYLRILRERYDLAGPDLADLPGPLANPALPEGPGIVHVPTGVPLFDRPASERRFRVGPAAVASPAQNGRETPPQVASAPQASTPKPPPRAPNPRAPLTRLIAGTVAVRRPPTPVIATPSPATPGVSPPIQATRATGAPPSPDRSTSSVRTAPPPSGDDAQDRFALLELD